MNSLLLMAATCMMGQVAPPGQTLPASAQAAPITTVVQPAPAPAVSSTCEAPACSSCVAAQPCGCCDRQSLLQRLRARFGSCFHHDDCACRQKPACTCAAKVECSCAPKPVCACAPKPACPCPPKVDCPCSARPACCPVKVTCPCAVQKSCATCAPCSTCANGGTPVQQVSQQSGQQGTIHPRYVNRIGHEQDYSWVTGQLYYLHIDGGIWVVRYASVETEDRFGGSVVLAASTSMHNFREGDLVTVRGEILNEGRASRYLGGPLYRASVVDMVDRAD